MSSVGLESRILEVGCGEGILLNELRGGGFSHLFGIEPSRRGASRAQARGLSVRSQFLDEVEFMQPFDVIIASQVLEHFEDVEATLDLIRSKLRQGGVAQFTQANFAAPIPRFLGSGWYAWAPDQHYWHFTPSGLKALIARHGFRTVELNYCSLVHPWSWWYRIANRLPLAKDQFILMAERV